VPKAVSGDPQILSGMLIGRLLTELIAEQPI
jgi:hypothetical protein